MRLLRGCVWVMLIQAGWVGAQATPEGLWETYNDEHTRVQSWVRIEKHGEFWMGRVEKILDPDAAPDERCDACKGDKKGLPIKGLTIIEGVPANVNLKGARGGKILDPESGQEYRLELELAEQGKVLAVRGYWGPFWRTQRWMRVNP